MYVKLKKNACRKFNLPSGMVRVYVSTTFELSNPQIFYKTSAVDYVELQHDWIETVHEMNNADRYKLAERGFWTPFNKNRQLGFAHISTLSTNHLKEIVKNCFDSGYMNSRMDARTITMWRRILEDEINVRLEYERFNMASNGRGQPARDQILKYIKSTHLKRPTITYRTDL